MFPVGLFVGYTYPLLHRHQNTLAHAIITISSIVLLGMVVAFYQMFVPHPTVSGEGKIQTLIPVDQINRNNVKNLKEAWRYRTGDFSTGSGNGAGNTILSRPQEADTGKHLWKAQINSKADAWERCRGVAYFDSTKLLQQPTLAGSTVVTAVTINTVCPQRIYTNAPDERLIGVNAQTGQRCEDFGEKGTVNLLEGLGEGTKAPRFEVTSAPTIAGTTIVVGSRIADNFATDMPSGVIRGYDVITGKLRWAFDLTLIMF